MNHLAIEKQQAIIQGYNHTCSIKAVARIVECSPITVRKYLLLNGNRIRTISEAMKKYHELRRGRGVVDHRLPCGKTRKDCVNCRQIFEDICTITIA